MKKQIKLIITAITAVALLTGCGLWVYMSAEVPLNGVLPQEQWYHMSLVNVVFKGQETEHRRYTVGEADIGQAMETLCGTKAERYRAFDGSDEDYFWIAFSTEDWSGRSYIVGNGPDMWNLYLGANGLLRVFAPDGEAFYFENCQELYRQMEGLAEKLECSTTISD